MKHLGELPGPPKKIQNIFELAGIFLFWSSNEVKWKNFCFFNRVTKNLIIFLFLQITAGAETFFCLIAIPDDLIQKNFASKWCRDDARVLQMQSILAIFSLS